MESSPSDGELLARSVDEPAAFAGIYERHGLPVRRYVVRRVEEGSGDDLGSEVFVRAFRGRARYRAEHSSALPWLLGIANHVIADHRRVERRRLTALEHLAGDMPPTDEHAGAGLALELVAALRALPAVGRDTLLLVVWGELTQEEAAVALGVPVGTVSSRITRARQRLAESSLRAGSSPSNPNLRPSGEANV